MQNIVDQVIQAEERAKALLGAARQKATEARNQAEIEISQMLKEAREEAQKFIQGAVTTAREEAEREHQRMVQQAETENLAFMEHNQERIAGLVEQAVNLIITPEYRRG